MYICCTNMYSNMLKIKWIKAISVNGLFYLPKTKYVSIVETKLGSPCDSFRLLSWSGLHSLKLRLRIEGKEKKGEENTFSS